MPLARYALYSQGEQIHVAPTAFDEDMAIVNAPRYGRTPQREGMDAIEVSVSLTGRWQGGCHGVGSLHRS